MNLSVFRKPVVMAREEDSVLDVAQNMRTMRVGCVVVTRDKRPAGIITDRDLALRVVAEGRDPRTTRVADVVTYDPFTLGEDDTLTTAVARMREHGVRRMPIIDSKGDLSGIVTADDLIVLLGRELGELCQGLDESSDSSESR